MAREFGPTAQKVLLLLIAGFTLGLTHSPRQYFKIIRSVGRAWREIDNERLHRSIKKLYQSKLISCLEHPDGSVTLVLREEGRQKVIKYHLNTMTVPKMKKWDGKWRVFLFDIPEGRKKVRDGLRYHLKRLGFRELQKSVFVHPYECEKELEFLIEFYGVKPYVRLMLAEHVDNELHLKKKFKLLGA